jgi:hypothetical protein
MIRALSSVAPPIVARIAIVTMLRKEGYLIILRSYFLLFPESSHEDIRADHKMMRSAKNLILIDSYDPYNLWLCQYFL